MAFTDLWEQQASLHIQLADEHRRTVKSMQLEIANLRAVLSRRDSTESVLYEGEQLLACSLEPPAARVDAWLSEQATPISNLDDFAGSVEGARSPNASVKRGSITSGAPLRLAPDHNPVHALPVLLSQEAKAYCKRSRQHDGPLPGGHSETSAAHGGGRNPADDASSSSTSSKGGSQATPRSSGVQAPDGNSSRFVTLPIWARLADAGPGLRRQQTIISSCTSSHSFGGMPSECQSSADDEEFGTESLHCAILVWLQRLMVQPSSFRHLVWEVCGLFMIMYDIVAIPLQILGPPENAFTVAATWVIRVFWSIDIPISFLTGFLSPQGEVEMRITMVARKYARTRFPLDVFIVGCDWAEVAIAASGGAQGMRGDAAILQLLGMLRAIRLIRLVRLAKSQKLTELIFERIRSEGVKLVALIVAIMVMLLGLIHVIACIWCGVHLRPWAAAQPKRSLMDTYMESFHFVLALTFGDQIVEPKTLGERCFIVGVLIFAFVVSAFFVGSLTTAMTRLQIIASQRSSQFGALNRYLSDNGISPMLTARIQRNARHAIKEQKRHVPESNVELLALISDPLRSEIHYEQFSPALLVHPFFRLYDQTNPTGVRNICHMAVSRVTLCRGDVLFSSYEVPERLRMFFVTSGRHAYFQGNQAQQQVSPRQWLSEAVLWTHWAHRGTLRAQTDSRLLVLDAQRFVNIMSTFPTPHPARYATRFVEMLNADCEAGGDVVLSDVGRDDERTRTVAWEVFFDGHSRLSELDAAASRRGSLFSTSRTTAARPSLPGGIWHGTRHSLFPPIGRGGVDKAGASASRRRASDNWLGRASTRDSFRDALANDGRSSVASSLYGSMTSWTQHLPALWRSAAVRHHSP